MTDKMYNEVNELFHYLGNNYMDKIPRDIIKYIQLHKSKDYQTKIHENINNFEDIGFSNDALSLIAYLNLEYWLDEKTKQELSNNYGICELEEIALDLFIQDFNHFRRNT